MSSLETTAPTNDSPNTRFAFLLPLALLAVLIFIWMLPTLPLGDRPARLGPDIILQFYPSHAFLKEQIAQGNLPYWNPYSFSGMPFLWNLQRTGYLYWDTLLFLLLPLTSAFLWSEAIHLFLVGAGGYVLLYHYTRNRWAAFLTAFCLSFGGMYIMRWGGGHLPTMQTAAWFPWTLYAAEKIIEQKRITLWTIAAGLMIALSLFAGFSEVTFMILLCVTLRFVFEAAVLLRQKNIADVRVLTANLLICFVLGVGLSAIQILPFLELAGQSARTNVNYDLIKQRSYPPFGVSTFFMPDFLGSPVYKNAVLGATTPEINAYFGAVPLVLSLLCLVIRPERRTYFYVTLSVIALFLAFGAYNPLYKIVNSLPVFSKVAAPYRYIYIIAIAGPILAGLSLSALMEKGFDPKRLRLVTILTGITTLVFGAIALSFVVFRGPFLAAAKRIILSRYSDDPGRRLEKLEGLYSLQIIEIAIFAVIALALCLLLIYRKRSANAAVAFGAAVVALIMIDLTGFHYKYPLNLEPNIENKKSYENFLAQDTSLYRVNPMETVIDQPEIGLTTGIQSIAGYDSLMSRSYRSYLLALEEKPEEHVDTRVPQLENYKSPLLDPLNVKYITTKRTLDAPNLRLVHDGKIKVYERSGFMPRAYIAHEMESLPSEEAVLQSLKQDAQRRVARIVNPPSLTIRPLTAEQREADPVVTYNNPNRLTVQAQAAAPGILVVSEMFTPGWTALLDGKPVPILRTNYLFRGIALPEGSHTVVLTFAPASRQIGKAVSLATLLLFLVSTVYLWRQHKISHSKASS
jgi:hypothetical protein